MFSEPQMVSLVICPRRNEKVWYGWVLDRLSELPPSGGDILDLSDGPPRRRRLTAVLAAALIAGAAGGFGIGTAARPAAPATANAPSSAHLQTTVHDLRSRLSSEQSARQELQTRLSATQSALQRERQRATTASHKGTVYVHYRVKPDDTMWQLAISFYGTPAAWPKIARPSGIKDPNHIEVGQVLRIPVPARSR
jgi:nucleoid-associated protein YgaU